MKIENDEGQQRIIDALKPYIGTKRYLTFSSTPVKITGLHKGDFYELYFEYYKLDGDRRCKLMENTTFFLETTRLIQW